MTGRRFKSELKKLRLSDFERRGALIIAQVRGFEAGLAYAVACAQRKSSLAEKAG